MTLLFNLLPYEIVHYHLIPLLDPESLVALSEVLDFEVSKQTFQKCFHERVEHEQYNITMFRERAKAHLWVVGGTNQGNSYLRKTPRSQLEDVLSHGRKTMFKRMHTPVMPPFQGVISDVAITYSSLRILGGNGQICSQAPYTANTKGTSPRFFKKVRSYLKNRKQRSAAKQDARSIARLRPLPAKYSLNVSDDNPKFTSIVNSFAIDESGLVWSWPKCNAEVGPQPCLLEEMSGKVVTGRCLAIRAGGILFIEGRGLFVWSGSRRKFRYRSERQVVYLLRGQIVPGTASNVCDFILDHCTVLYLLSDGTVHGCFLLLYSKMLKMDTEELNQLGPFSRLYSSETSRHIYLLTTTGNVVTATERWGNWDRPRVFWKRGQIQCTGLAQGASHNLLITSRLLAYSWGLENYCGGCLGLGRFSKAVEQKHVTISVTGKSGTKTMVADRPTKIEIPGKVYAVYAENEISALLVYQDEKESLT